MGTYFDRVSRELKDYSTFRLGPEISRHWFRIESGQLVEMVTVPLHIGPDPPEILGTLSLGFALDRVDTNGRNREAGTRTGGWLRYTRHWGDDF